MRLVSAEAFSQRAKSILSEPRFCAAGWVTGPGRSGAVAAVYASHVLRIPFVPFGAAAAPRGRPLVIDTARSTGAALRKALRRYESFDPIECVLFEEPPRVQFWYELPIGERS